MADSSNQVYHFPDLVEKTQALLKESHQFFLHSDDNNLIQLAKNIPLRQSENDSVKIVFAGQYSAGKSTLLSILTNTPLKTGGGITTVKTKCIDWNGLSLWDTPGILTKVHPEHDEITKDIMSKADLIVYVITAKLFDSVLLKDFRELAFSRDRKGEIMLVVNKMRDDANGNTPENHAVKNANLCAILAPSRPEDFYVTYVDADAWFEAETAANDVRRARNLRESNIEQLKHNLDGFSKEKGWIAQKKTGLYTLDRILDEAQKKVGSQDPDIDKSLECLSRLNRMYVDARDSLLLKTASHVSEFEKFSNIEKAKLAGVLEDGMTQEAFNEAEAKTQAAILTKYDAACEAIKKVIREESENLEKKLSDFDKSAFASDIIDSLNGRMERMDKFISDQTQQNIKKGAGYVDKFAQWLRENTKGKGFGSVSGSNVHEAVLKIGHFFGHKFKPYEALKWTQKIKGAGAALSIAGVVIGVAGQAADDIQAAKIADNLKKNRNLIRSHYTQEINKKIKKLNHYVEQLIKEEIDPEIASCMQKKKNVQGIISQKETLFAKLGAFRERILDLIREFNRLDVVPEE